MFEKIRAGKTEQTADSSAEFTRKVNENFAKTQRALNDVPQPIQLDELEKVIDEYLGEN